MGLSAVIPTVHYCITDGFWAAVYEASFGWLLLMAFLYIGGALMYAWRIPERFFPGKFDLWVTSHLYISHLFVSIISVYCSFNRIRFFTYLW